MMPGERLLVFVARYDRHANRLSADFRTGKYLDRVWFRRTLPRVKEFRSYDIHAGSRDRIFGSDVVWKLQRYGTNETVLA